MPGTVFKPDGHHHEQPPIHGPIVGVDPKVIAQHAAEFEQERQRQLQSQHLGPGHLFPGHVSDIPAEKRAALPLALQLAASRSQVMHPQVTTATLHVAHPTATPATVAPKVIIAKDGTFGAAGVDATVEIWLPDQLYRRYCVAPEGRGFVCLDGLQSIPHRQLNDDYCDCADGSDEPGTNACAHLRMRFFCASGKVQSVFSSMVNDGVCDCEDASDEYSSGAACARRRRTKFLEHIAVSF